MTIETVKVCKKCEQEKPLTEFWISDKARGYLRSSCKECDKIVARAWYHRSPENKAKAYANSRKQALAKPRTPKQARDYSLKNKYDLPHGEYERLLASQDGRCALCQSADCGRKSGKWSAGHFMVDHCHSTGRVRGLLCHTCNVALGAYERLMTKAGPHKMVAYLSAA